MISNARSRRILAWACWPEASVLALEDAWPGPLRSTGPEIAGGTVPRRGR
jgi:hypothetical protein